LVAACDLGWYWPFTNIAVITQKPTKISIVDGVLHCDGGPAISYKGDFNVWALHGVRVDKYLAETPHNELDPKMFAKIRNVEIRKEFLRKFGMERLMKKLDCKLVDKGADDENQYELYNIDLGGNTGTWPYLKMWNTSEEVWHVECVSRDCRTVEAALEFRTGCKGKPIAES